MSSISVSFYLLSLFCSQVFLFLILSHLVQALELSILLSFSFSPSSRTSASSFLSYSIAAPLIILPVPHFFTPSASVGPRRSSSFSFPHFGSLPFICAGGLFLLLFLFLFLLLALLHPLSQLFFSSLLFVLLASSFFCIFHFIFHFSFFVNSFNILSIFFFYRIRSILLLFPFHPIFTLFLLRLVRALRLDILYSSVYFLVVYSVFFFLKRQHRSSVSFHCATTYNIFPVFSLPLLDISPVIFLHLLRTQDEEPTLSLQLVSSD